MSTPPRFVDYVPPVHEGPIPPPLPPVMEPLPKEQRMLRKQQKEQQRASKKAEIEVKKKARTCSIPFLCTQYVAACASARRLHAIRGRMRECACSPRHAVDG
jgi:hypothetical protein